MARITIEDFDAARHPNSMASVDNGQAIRTARVGHLVPYKVCVVDACSLHRPSSRIAWNSGAHGDHWECQRWYEQLPLRLLDGSKRPVVVDALERALVEYSKYPSARTDTAKPPLLG